MLIQIIAIFLMLIIPISLIAFFVIIIKFNKNDNYKCHVDDCEYSFKSTDELINHLVDTHKYNIKKRNIRV